jgi:hypothetical protein
MTQVWLQHVEPVRGAVLEEILVREVRKPYQGQYLVTRPDPLQGKTGPLDVNSTVVQAVLYTITNGVALQSPWFRRRISDFVRDPKWLANNSSFEYKVLVAQEIYEECRRSFCGIDFMTSWGSVENPMPTRIVNYETTNHYWLKSNSHFEVLFDNKKPRTVFMFYSAESDDFWMLAQQHKQRNIFLGGYVEFVLPFYHGWAMPVVGVTEIYLENRSTIHRLHPRGIDHKLKSDEMAHTDFFLEPKCDRPPKFLEEFSGLADSLKFYA